MSKERRTKNKIKKMILRCPFCGQDMICIEDSWCDSVLVGGEQHSSRELVFEHRTDHIDDEPWLESGCGCEIVYHFVEAKNDSEREAQSCPSCDGMGIKWNGRGFIVCNICGYNEEDER